MRKCVASLGEKLRALNAMVTVNDHLRFSGITARENSQVFVGMITRERGSVGGWVHMQSYIVSRRNYVRRTNCRRINEDNLALSGKSSIIIIPRMPQFPNASCKRQRFSGNAYVRDLFVLGRNVAARQKGGVEMQRRNNTRYKGERRVHTCSPFVTDSVPSQQAENALRT